MLNVSHTLVVPPAHFNNVLEEVEDFASRNSSADNDFWVEYNCVVINSMQSEEWYKLLRIVAKNERSLIDLDSDFDKTRLINLLPFLDRVFRIFLRFKKLTTEEMELLSRALAYGSPLRSLSIAVDDAFEVPDQDCIPLIHLPLSTLAMHNFKLNSRSIRCLNGRLLRGSSLVSLDLTQCGITGEKLTLLARGLMKTGNLRELYFNKNPGSSTLAFVVAGVLQALPDIERVHMEETDTDDAGCEAIVHSISNAKQFWDLNLSGNHITNIDSLAHLISPDYLKADSNRQGLRHLTIDSNPIQKDSLSNFLRVLSTNRRLRQLDLSDVALDDQNSRLLSEVLKANDALYSFNSRGPHKYNDRAEDERWAMFAIHTALIYKFINRENGTKEIMLKTVRSVLHFAVNEFDWVAANRGYEYCDKENHDRESSERLQKINFEGICNDFLDRLSKSLLNDRLVLLKEGRSSQKRKADQISIEADTVAMPVDNS
jgi:hypothetical protein